MRFIALAAILALIACLLAGCIFSPDRTDKKKPTPPPPIPYPVFSNPQNVLDALRLAYENRDSVGYRKLFEPDYQGISYDSTGVLTFTRIDEERHIRSLAENINIVSVSLDLGIPGQWNPTPFISERTGEEWVEIAVFDPQIGITEGRNSLQTVANETFAFRFRSRVAPESTTGKLWHIVEWEESR